MSTELIPQVGSNETALAVAGSGDFLPRIQLCQSQTKHVQQGHVGRGGNYALIRGEDEVEDLGNEVEAIVCAGRAKALRIDDNGVIVNFDPNSNVFKQIQEESKVRDSGCMFGPEYLLWLPSHGEFVTLFLCNPTGRRAAKSLHALLRSGAVVKSKLIETQKYSWFGPVFKSCDSNLEPPDVDALQAEVEKFEKEKSSEVETVAEEDGRER